VGKLYCSKPVWKKHMIPRISFFVCLPNVLCYKQILILIFKRNNIYLAWQLAEAWCSFDKIQRSMRVRGAGLKNESKFSLPVREAKKNWLHLSINYLIPLILGDMVNSPNTPTRVVCSFNVQVDFLEVDCFSPRIDFSQLYLGFRIPEGPLGKAIFSSLVRQLMKWNHWQSFRYWKYDGDSFMLLNVATSSCKYLHFSASCFYFSLWLFC
jgi:hypothetical protein